MTDPVPIEEGSIQGAITSPVQAKLMLSVVGLQITSVSNPNRGFAAATVLCTDLNQEAFVFLG